MNKIILLNVESLIAALLWGNLVSMLFLILYFYEYKITKEKPLMMCLIFSRLLHALYYFVACGRNILPSWLSVNFGNTILFIGFYFEAQAMFRVIKEWKKSTVNLLRCILIVSIVLFNVIDFIMASSGIRVTVASICVVAIMFMPCIRMFISPDSKPFTKLSAVFYSIFLLLLLPRAWYSLQNQDVGILTSSLVQSLTFLSLLLLLIIGLPTYLSIIKDYSDDALLLMATTDRLTGATNRHAFTDAAAAIYDDCKSFRIPLSIMFIDIDIFKNINDSYGHLFGDVVLARLAEIIHNCLRKSDLSCRYGGEEFVVLLYPTQNAFAQCVADRIMDEVRSARFEEQPDFTFTVSIGISCGVPSNQNILDDSIKNADEAMYEAKNTGRNRVVLKQLEICHNELNHISTSF